MSQEPGVYLFLDAKGNVIYVGKAKNLRERVKSYFVNKDLGEKTKMLVSQISSLKTLKVFSEFESLLLEVNLIQKYKPKYNVRFMDGKAYPFIRITVKDDYPKVLVARRMEDKKSLYFGPFPNAGAMRSVLKILRRIFPYQSVINHQKKPCLYFHLGLCPCPEFFKDKNYKKNIRYIINFLYGKTVKVVKDLEKEREKYTKSEKFEKAAQAQKKISSIIQITTFFYQPNQYEENPNLTSDIREKELSSLREILNSKGLNVNKLTKIECYDISNLQGKFATGSLIAFIDGEKKSSLYRRFRIRLSNGKPNDFAMMSEVIKRRFTHKEWSFPDLLIVDGGKGQVSTAVSTLKQIGLHIPVIGLAKRLETIVTSDLQEVSLPRDSKALHLLMRIRDEAHRFAITYHKKLRGNYFLETV